VVLRVSRNTGSGTTPPVPARYTKARTDSANSDSGTVGNHLTNGGSRPRARTGPRPSVATKRSSLPLDLERAKRRAGQPLAVFGWELTPVTAGHDEPPVGVEVHHHAVGYGMRKVFVCPQCKTKRRTLYSWGSDRWRCRVCWGARYESARSASGSNRRKIANLNSSRSRHITKFPAAIRYTPARGQSIGAHINCFTEYAQLGHALCTLWHQRSVERLLANDQPLRFGHEVFRMHLEGLLSPLQYLKLAAPEDAVAIERNAFDLTDRLNQLGIVVEVNNDESVAS
jgi:ribosomal protein L37AE/L43A